MWVILKQPWCDFPAGRKVSVSDARAYALLDAGIATEVEKPRPALEPKPEAEPAPDGGLAEALGIPSSPARKGGRPRKK